MSERNPMPTKLEKLREMEAKATKGPWTSNRQGNQSIETGYMPTSKVVGASVIPQVVRPWNPHAYIAFGMKAEKHEEARFTDSDGDFIAALRNHAPRLFDLWEAAEEWRTDPDAADCKLKAALDALEAQ